MIYDIYVLISVFLLFHKCSFPTYDQPCCFGTYRTVPTKAHFSDMQHSPTFHITIKLLKLYRIPSENISHTQADTQLLENHISHSTMPDACPTHYIQLMITT